jgi:hypothetical protein
MTATPTSILIFSKRMTKNEMTMKKKEFSTIVSLFCMMLLIASCSSEDNVANDVTTDAKSVTFSVSEDTTGYNELTRSSNFVEPETVTKDVGDMTLRFTMVDEGSIAQTRTNTAGTPTKKQIANGTAVTAYVYGSDNIIESVQNISVTNSQLTVKVPSQAVSVAFYIGSNAPVAAKGNVITSVYKDGVSATYTDMWAKGSVSAGATTITPATLLFYHVFSEAKVTIKSNDDTGGGDGITTGNLYKSKVNAFTTTLSGIAATTAKVYATGKYDVSNATAKDIQMNATGGTAISLSSDYVPVVLSNNGASKAVTLKMYDITTDGSKKMFTENNGTSLDVKFTNTYVAGHKYNFTISATPNYHFYVWDQKNKNADGTWKTYFQDHTSYNTITTGTASYACKNCITSDQAKMYLGAGIYKDDTHEWTWQRITGKGGWWIKKSTAIAGFSNGTASKVELIKSGGTNSSLWLTSKPTDLATNWFFVPANGWIDDGELVWVGKRAGFWTNTPGSTSTVTWGIDFSESSATVYGNLDYRYTGSPLFILDNPMY